MLRDDVALVREIVKEEIAAALAKFELDFFKTVPEEVETPKPVEEKFDTEAPMGDLKED